MDLFGRQLNILLFKTLKDKLNIKCLILKKNIINCKYKYSSFEQHYNGYSLSNVAAEIGDLSLLIYMNSNEHPWNERTIDYAAGNGHVHIIKYLRANGHKWWHTTFSHASASGSLDTIKWLHVNGCPCDEYAITDAAAYGHLDIVKWFHANDYFRLTRKSYCELCRDRIACNHNYSLNRHEKEIISRIIDVATKRGHLDIVKYVNDHWTRL